MAKTTIWPAAGVVRHIGLGIAELGLSLALVGSSTVAQEVPTFMNQDFGVIPRSSSPMMLLGFEPVQEELRLTDAQKKELEAIREGRVQKLQKARGDSKNRGKLREVQDAILKESQAAIREGLTPEQRERLDQIHFQFDGPAAFSSPEAGALGFNGPPLSERLKLSEDQDRQVRALVDDGEREITKAARFVIPLDSKQGPISMDSIRALVESPQFQEAKRKARQAARDASDTLLQRIEATLTDTQRGAYHALRGAPFDLSRLILEGTNQRDFDISRVAASLRLGGGGQRADPSFDTTVGLPAYANGAHHPRVLFDEAHNNFHTAGGRYKPFAELVANDGYQVIANSEKFSRAMLQKGEILVIANALGAGAIGQPEASNPAFTDAECDAVRDWVRDGGNLLFITDHAPFGAAVECLAMRLGVAIGKGEIFDPANSERGETFLVFTRQNHLLGNHPITQGRDDSERINRVQTFTGTSIKGPVGSIPILRLAGTATDRSLQNNTTTSTAGHAQGIAFTLGKGRVVVLGEAAQLSAQIIGLGGEKFGMNVPGLDNRQMALNIFHWLSGLLEPGEASP